MTIKELKTEKQELKQQINELTLESHRVNRFLLEDSRKGFWKRLFTYPPLYRCLNCFCPISKKNS